jgi:DNA (cytosine-5)-methyltransferase 1
MKVGSLFAGIGGFDLGFERAGMEVVWQVEIDPFCNKVLAKHWPDVKRYLDVKEVGKHNLEPVDLICGGFPCQDLSSAGQRKGIYAERSGLWGELYRIMCELRPSYTLIENVTGLLSGDDGRWFGRLLMDMAEGGFNVEWECIPASSIGAPHHRDRVYLIAYPCENGWLRIFSKTNFKVRRNLGNYFRADWFGCGEGAWSGWQTKDKEEFLSQPLIGREDDGFPRSLDRLSSLGNAVVPQIVEIIGRAIMEVEDEVDR